MPHFQLEYENRGNTPVAFSDFFLILPRIEGAIDSDGKFNFHQGAELLIDKRPTTRVGGYQLARAMDYRTNKVPLEPGEMHTDFFDFGAFFPNVTEGKSRWGSVHVPSDFQPILSFHDNFGNTYYCDDKGVHRGRWQQQRWGTAADWKRSDGSSDGSAGTTGGLTASENLLSLLVRSDCRSRSKRQDPEAHCPLLGGSSGRSAVVHGEALGPERSAPHRWWLSREGRCFRFLVGTEVGTDLSAPHRT
jgi:hypothetical protein